MLGGVRGQLMEGSGVTDRQEGSRRITSGPAEEALRLLCETREKRKGETIVNDVFKRT